MEQRGEMGDFQPFVSRWCMYGALLIGDIFTAVHQKLVLKSHGEVWRSEGALAFVSCLGIDLYALDR